MTSTKTIMPGATIGILGDGQLGKMIAQAAAKLGYKTAVWGECRGVAMDVATYPIDVKIGDTNILEEFAKVDVVTNEWENIPLGVLARLEQRNVRVCPSWQVMEVVQNRYLEKKRARELGIPITNTVSVRKNSNVHEWTWGDYLPGILKTTFNGYDGKGQWRVSSVEELTAAVQEADCDCVLEKEVQLDREISVLVARNASGETKVSPAVANQHEKGILKTTEWRVDLIDPKHEKAAQDAAIKLANRLELVGILVVEFFISEGRVLFNEMAARPHNSFHGTIEAAYTSQFEQLVRAICNLPLDVVDFHFDFTMENLLGVDPAQFVELMRDEPDYIYHFYGKDVRPGRKMGHRILLG